MCERDCEYCSVREDIKNLVPICDAAIDKGVVQDIERGNVVELSAG